MPASFFCFLFFVGNPAIANYQKSVLVVYLLNGSQTRNDGMPFRKAHSTNRERNREHSGHGDGDTTDDENETVEKHRTRLQSILKKIVEGRKGTIIMTYCMCNSWHRRATRNHMYKKKVILFISFPTLGARTSIWPTGHAFGRRFLELTTPNWTMSSIITQMMIEVKQT